MQRANRACEGSETEEEASARERCRHADRVPADGASHAHDAVRRIVQGDVVGRQFDLGTIHQESFSRTGGKTQKGDPSQH